MGELTTFIVDHTVVPIANLIGAMAAHGVLFLVFAALWLVVGAGILLNQSGVDGVWAWIGAQPILIQLCLWFLFLPVMVGLWIWQTDWPIVARALLVAAVACWTLLVMAPEGNRASCRPADRAAAHTRTWVSVN